MKLVFYVCSYVCSYALYIRSLMINTSYIIYPLYPVKSARILAPIIIEVRSCTLYPSQSLLVLTLANRNQCLPSQLINSILFQRVFSVFNLLCRFVESPFCNDFINKLFAKSLYTNPNNYNKYNTILLYYANLHYQTQSQSKFKTYINYISNHVKNNCCIIIKLVIICIL